MIVKNKKIVLVFIFCCSLLTAGAQQYGYKAPLDTIKKNGFYRIAVTPELSAHIKTDFSDLRVIDDNDKWVPHIIKPDLPFFQENAFQEFPIISYEIADSGRSALIINNTGNGIIADNQKSYGINEIVLFIKNASVSRYATLSGSNDKIHWYIIAENSLLNRNYQTPENYFTCSVKFATSDYKYFKLTINNENTDPLNIIKAGSYLVFSFQPYGSIYLTNPNGIISQKDSSDGKSYIKFQQSKAVHIDRIALQITGSPFFERTGAVYLPLNDTMDNVINPLPVLDFSISSKKENTIEIKRIKAKTLYLVINNKDNPPLQINSIETRQLENSIITYLEKGKHYYLLTDNTAALKPDYDLEIFKDSIPALIDTIGIGTFSNIEKNDPQVKKSNSNKWWLWPAITVAIVMLGYLTWKLMADMKTNDV